MSVCRANKSPTGPVAGGGLIPAQSEPYTRPHVRPFDTEPPPERGRLRARHKPGPRAPWRGNIG